MPKLFLLLVLGCSLSINAQVNVTTGKSFVNITRPNGGTFLPGDVIEVRATIAINGGTSNDNTYINRIRYNDTINSSKFEYIPGSMRMLSNEGIQQGAAFTDAASNDAANISGNFIRFNIGTGSDYAHANVASQTNSATGGGQLRRTDRPSFYGGTCIRMYVFQVRILNTPSIVALDSLITLNAGNFRYRIGNSNTDQISNFRPYKIRIAPDYGLCSNAIGSNAILGEEGGTFGSGTTQNKPGGTAFVPAPYTRINFGNNAPQDNYFGVANTTSANGSVNNSVAMGNAARVFTVWDIIGDHTGAADPLVGNPPSLTGGYALVINASYQTNLAFRQTISNLCEETFYEFSAWFRNICSRCGCDVEGRGASDPNYIQTTPGDFSGVKPNLSFQIDGEEYYTSGNIAYTGQWVKKGFVFKTKPGQTSFTVTIRNNAPGGGGNDWAIDDIAVATCLPNMSYSPSLTPNICIGNPITIYDTVRSYFDNYRYFQWQYLEDGASTWSNIGGPVGPVTPVNTGGNWEYVAEHTIPPSHTTTDNTGDRYRLVVATSSTNLLNETCRSTDDINAITLNVITCTPILSTNLLSFNAVQQSNQAQLTWSTSKENELLYFDVERSTNGINFEKISSINSLARYAQPQNNYSFTDKEANHSKLFYRIRMYNKEGKTSYSKIISLGQTEANFTVNNVINPFNQEIKLDITATQKDVVTVELNDYSGKKLKQNNFDIKVGVNILRWEGMNDLPYGMYIIRITGKSGKTTTHKLVKSAKR